MLLNPNIYYTFAPYFGKYQNTYLTICSCQHAQSLPDGP